MPMYTWTCKTCKQVYFVIRSFKDYEIPPSRIFCEKCKYFIMFENAPEKCPCCGNEELITVPYCDKCGGEEFERNIGKDIVVSKSPNWGGGKGYW